VASRPLPPSRIEADAALKRLRAELTPGDGDGDGVPEAVAGSRGELSLAEPRTGPTPGRTASNATVLSRTDPDAKLRHKPGHRTHLVHRGQVAVDPKARVIVAVVAERATGSEADCLKDLVTRARFGGHTVAELAADSGYASRDAYAALGALGTVALIAPQPGAKHAAAEQARERMRAATGRDAAFDRQAHAEGAIAELKRHGGNRARCRGTRLVQLQLLAAATAINLKRLLKADTAQANGQPGDPPARAAITALIGLLARILHEIGRLTGADSSTGLH
jgi:hypothetical protein